MGLKYFALYILRSWFIACKITKLSIQRSSLSVAGGFLCIYNIYKKGRTIGYGLRIIYQNRDLLSFYKTEKPMAFFFRPGSEKELIGVRPRDIVLKCP